MKKIAVVALLLAAMVLLVSCGGGGGGGGGSGSKTTMKAKVELQLNPAKTAIPMPADPYLGAKATLKLPDGRSIKMTYLGNGEFEVEVTGIKDFQGGYVEFVIGSMTVKNLFGGIRVVDGVMDTGTGSHLSTFVTDLLMLWKDKDSPLDLAKMISNGTADFDVKMLKALLLEDDIPQGLKDAIADYLAVYNADNMDATAQEMQTMLTNLINPAKEEALTIVTGGGFTIPGTMTLTGTYNFADVEPWLYWNNWVTNSYYGNTGKITFDDDHSCSVSVSGRQYEMMLGEGNVPKNVSTRTEPFSADCSYYIDGEGRMTFVMKGEETEVVNFWVAKDGITFIAGGAKYFDEGENQDYRGMMLIGVKEASGMTKSSLNSTWRMGELSAGLFKPTNSALNVGAFTQGGTVTAEFDGVGGMTASMDQRSFYEAFTPASAGFATLVGTETDGGSISGDYSVTSKGALTLDFEDFSVTGHVGSGGNVFLLGTQVVFPETTTTEYSVQLMAGVRQVTTLNLSSVEGTYEIVSLQNGFEKPGATGTPVVSYIKGNRITATFDGSGGCNGTSNENVFKESYAGTPVSAPDLVSSEVFQHSFQCSYTLGEDAHLRIDLGNEVVDVGVVSPDGNVVIGARAYETVGANDLDYGIDMLFGVRTK